jgi:hypothetical protein
MFNNLIARYESSADAANEFTVPSSGVDDGLELVLVMIMSQRLTHSFSSDRDSWLSELLRR